MKKWILLLTCSLYYLPAFSWGFYGHQQINYHAVFLLPPEMLLFFKPNIQYLQEHAVDPDKRRYIVPDEGPRHYIDLDHYGKYPFDALPRNFSAAKEKYTEDTLKAHGIVPWWLETMMNRLTRAFREKDHTMILKYAAELGHYIADAHVPLHTSSNHNGQLSGQKGIHGLWESRIPELLAAPQPAGSTDPDYRGWDFFIGRAIYLDNPSQFFWDRILESGKAADSVLSIEKTLSRNFNPSRRFSYENRKGTTIRQYSVEYTRAYNKLLNGMVERRMQQSIFAVASCWYTAWINAGQPDMGPQKAESSHYTPVSLPLIKSICFDTHYEVNGTQFQRRPFYPAA